MNKELEVPGAVPGVRQPNPYAPPEARVDDMAPQRPVARKPISAWLVQLFTASVVVLVLIGLYPWASRLLSSRGVAWSWGFFLLQLVWRAVLLAPMLGAFIGTQRRANYGRWCGLVCIALFFALCTYVQFFQAKAPIPASSNLTPAEAGGELFAVLLILGLIVWWFYAFGFSAKSRKYFLGAASDDRR